MTTEVFFRPDPVRQQATIIPASLYNRCRLLLSHSDNGCLFVPIRSMQYLAVIDNEEVIFVDSQAYAVREGEGGRIIMITWRFDEARGRDSLSEPVPIQVVHHHQKTDSICGRLLGEFDKALVDMDQRGRDLGNQLKIKKVVDFPVR